MPSVYTLAIRHHNGWEALLAQKHVIDYRRTLHPENNLLHICHDPGEVVIPGGVKRTGESLGQAALRIFCEKTNQPPPQTATLWSFYQIRDQHFMLLRDDENGWLTLTREGGLDDINARFALYEEAVTIDPQTGRLVSSWPWRCYQDTYQFFWRPLRDVLELFPDKKLDEWQARQYERAQQVAPFYENYPLVLVSQNRRRDFSRTFEQALSKLINEHPVTSIQVYPEGDRDRTTLLMLGRAGRITYANGVEQLKGDHFDIFAPPRVGDFYMVWAYNGNQRVLPGRTMSYAGTDEFGRHTFVKTSYGDEEHAEERADQEAAPRRGGRRHSTEEGMTTQYASMQGDWGIEGLPPTYVVSLFTLTQVEDYVAGGLDISNDETLNLQVTGNNNYPAVSLNFNKTTGGTVFRFQGQFSDANTVTGTLSGKFTGSATLLRADQ
jgi:hypothetical protein